MPTPPFPLVVRSWQEICIATQPSQGVSRTIITEKVELRVGIKFPPSKFSTPTRLSLRPRFYSHLLFPCPRIGLRLGHERFFQLGCEFLLPCLISSHSPFLSALSHARSFWYGTMKASICCWSVCESPRITGSNTRLLQALVCDLVMAGSNLKSESNSACKSCKRNLRSRNHNLMKE